MYNVHLVSCWLRLLNSASGCSTLVPGVPRGQPSNSSSIVHSAGWCFSDASIIRLYGALCSAVLPMYLLGCLCMYWAAYICTGLPMYVLGCLCMYWAACVCTGLPMYVLGCLCMFWAAYVCTELPMYVLGCLCMY